WVDFGEPIGVRPSSAQLTRRYTPESLVGTPVLAVVNFPPLRVAGFRSEVLVLGVINPDDPGAVVLVRPDDPAVEGWALGCAGRRPEPDARAAPVPEPLRQPTLGDASIGPAHLTLPTMEPPRPARLR